MTGYRNSDDRNKAIDGVLVEVQRLVERTEHHLDTNEMQAEELRESSVRMAEIRALLGDLAEYSARFGSMAADGADRKAHGHRLAKRCLDIEGRIKEKRNDVLRAAASDRMRHGAKGGEKDRVKTILVVEDDADVRIMIRSVLNEYGYSVLEAANGSQAMDLFVLHQEAINLSLIDIFLPGKNGKELSEDLRRLRPDAKVLFTSGYSAEPLSTQDLMYPGTDFIVKPSSPKDLVSKIENLLQS